MGEVVRKAAPGEEAQLMPHRCLKLGSAECASNAAELPILRPSPVLRSHGYSRDGVINDVSLPLANLHRSQRGKRHIIYVIKAVIRRSRVDVLVAHASGKVLTYKWPMRVVKGIS